MRENRPYGSEGGVAKAIPTPIRSTGPFHRRNPADAYCALRMIAVSACSPRPGRGAVEADEHLELGGSRALGHGDRHGAHQGEIADRPLQRDVDVDPDLV